MTPGGKTSLLLALIGLAFITGLLLKGGNKDAEKLLIQKMKDERKFLMDKVVEKQVRITHLQADSAAIRGKMYLDSVRFSEALQANQRAYLALKKKYNEINLSRADAHSLDSIITVLYTE